MLVIPDQAVCPRKAAWLAGQIDSRPLISVGFYQNVPRLCLRISSFQPGFLQRVQRLLPRKIKTRKRRTGEFLLLVGAVASYVVRMTAPYILHNRELYQLALDFEDACLDRDLERQRLLAQRLCAARPRQRRRRAAF